MNRIVMPALLVGFVALSGCMFGGAPRGEPDRVSDSDVEGAAATLSAVPREPSEGRGEALSGPTPEDVEPGQKDGWRYRFDQAHQKMFVSSDKATLMFDVAELRRTGQLNRDPKSSPRSFWGSVCMAACEALASVGCDVVEGACDAATVYTEGGTSFPCEVAVPLACGALGAAGDACAAQCPTGDGGDPGEYCDPVPCYDDGYGGYGSGDYYGDGVDEGCDPDLGCDPGIDGTWHHAVHQRR